MNRAALITVVVLTLAASVLPAADQPDTEASKGKPALLVMDVQNAYMPYMDEADVEGALRMINATIAAFRERGLPVIRVYHTDPERGPKQGTEPFEFPASVLIRADDPVVVKGRPSAFNGTELDRLLRDQGVDTIFLSGLSAVGCVLATYFEADGLDYRVFMVRGGLISHKAELTDAVEEMTGAVGYRAIEYMLDGAVR
jgi:nicotinamidase-related amidase